MPPAARIADMHVCPMVTGLVPHVGGPIALGCPTVIIGFMPAARVGDMAVCVGPPDTIAKGSAGVFIGGMPAARMGDMTVHGGNIVMGMPTVMIGEVGGGGGGGGSSGGSVAAAPAGGKKAFKSGVGDDVDKLVEKSPTLKKNLEDLKKKGWTIKYGDKGKGSYCDKTKKTIVIDGNEKGKPESVTQTLAHESGHALYQEEPYVPPKGLTKEDYVKKNVERHLKDEGEATLTNAQIRNEIKNNGGPDIGIAGQQSKKYAEIAKKYPDAKDRDKARKEIADVFAKGENPSTDPSKNYEDYYGKVYSDHWDKHEAPKRKKK